MITPVSAYDADEPAVTCGSVNKLQHVHTKSKGTYPLYDSEGKNRNGGSGQHLATFVKDDPTAQRSLWRVRPRHHGRENEEYPELLQMTPTCASSAQPIHCGDFLRLTNLETRRNLHSHAVKSPLSSQQEISVYEGEDQGDDWKLECLDAKDGVWRKGQRVKLQHYQTGKCLGASTDAEFNERTCGHNCPLMNHLESFGRACTDSLSELQAEQGIYLSL